MLNIDKLIPALIIAASAVFGSCTASPGGESTKEESNNEVEVFGSKPVPAAHRMKEYIPLLEGKRVGVIANHTSMVDDIHLVDTLLKSGINVMKVFSPEHGFRGKQDAGAKVENYRDNKTGLSVISLYGDSKKPTSEMLGDIDLLVFDIQDVGARFYTYISTLHYAMEAAAENGLPFMVLDRPNPNGHFVDGPVLESEFKSFVGMHPIPVVHGLTVGELAGMIEGEWWLEAKNTLDLTVIECNDYSHGSSYELPVAPSPNLKTQRAVYLYPSLCLFEGTAVSVGRGTNAPFEVYGMPRSDVGDFIFTPRSMEGARHPKHEGTACTGFDLRDRYSLREAQSIATFRLDWLMEMYRASGDREFFTSPDFFDKLAGTDKLRKMIVERRSEKEIRESWQPDLDEYRKMRKDYLLYPDFGTNLNQR